MRINWFSNAPWGASGYSNQTNLFTPMIKNDGHDISITCFWGLQGGHITWNGIPCFPGAFDGHGQDVMIPNALMWQSDILISLYDTWVMRPNHERLEKEVKWCPWFPVDHEPLPKVIADILRVAFLPIAMSKSGVKAANDAGIKCEYVPHGFDTRIYYPRHRALARKSLGFDADEFIVGIVAMNKGIPSRKAFTQQIEGFARFHREYPKSKLYIHTLMTPEMQGYNLWDILDAHNLREAVMVPDQFQYMQGYPPQFMADLYNSFDVLLSATMGEGFGIPILEAQACGTPVIVGEWTAMDELLFAGWGLDKETEAIPYMTPLGANQFVPSVNAIAKYLEEAYRMNELERFELRKAAREGAENYEMGHVYENYWKPVLKKIERKLFDERAKELKKGKRVA